jgi:hypothetical protein
VVHRLHLRLEFVHFFKQQRRGAANLGCRRLSAGEARHSACVRPIVNPPGSGPGNSRADCQSAAGYQEANVLAQRGFSAIGLHVVFGGADHRVLSSTSENDRRQKAIVCPTKNMYHVKQIVE